MTGTTPRGASSEQQASQWVQRMFGRIAPRYDFLNHLLSFQIDRRWRKTLVRSLESAVSRPNARILDLCCGTGDVWLDLRQATKASILGADFCHPMLLAAERKIARAGFSAALVEADALSLPLADETLDAISIAFGFRNLANYESGLRELYRVLRPGGILAILEFSHPPHALVKAAYGLYSRVLLPAIGTLLSGSPEAYTYLPESIRKFPAAEELVRMMQRAGFTKAKFELLTGGIAALHIAER